ncbi:hypothetical protein AMTRI_Chr08g206780 [Amborella trichopoda]
MPFLGQIHFEQMPFLGFTTTHFEQNQSDRRGTSKMTIDELLRNGGFPIHLAAGAGSVTFATAITYPLDTLKTLIQIGAGAKQQLDIYQVLGRVQCVSGITGLYRGFGWFALGRIPSVGVRFGTYELLTAFYKDGRENNHVFVSEALLAGFAAGALESIVNTPFELFKLRTQVACASWPTSRFVEAKRGTPSLVTKLLHGHIAQKGTWDQITGLLSTLPTKHTNVTTALQEYPWVMTGSGKPPSVSYIKGPLGVVSLEGWNALWRGLRSGIFRDSIFGGFFFSTWQFFHIIMLDWKAINMDPPPRSEDEVGPVSPLAASLVAGFSGSIAAAASHVFDTARCRSQSIVIPKYIAMERKLLKWKPLGSWFNRKAGIRPSDRAFLLRGLWLRVARSGVSCFAMVGGYYLIIQHLS